MRKSSSQSSGKRPGSDNPFKRDKGGNDARPFKKKNYNGRSAGEGADHKPGRKSAPYSGRTSDGDAGKPARPARAGGSFEKPSFRKSSPGDSDRNSRPERPFSDRKSDSDKRPGKPFEKRGGFEDRKPRSERPFSDRKSDGDKRPGKPFEKRGDFEDRKPRPERLFSDRKSDGDKRQEKPFEKRSGSDKPSYKKDDKEKYSTFKKAGKSVDTRPFRERQKPAPAPIPEVPDEISFSKDIDDVLPGKYNTPPADTKPYNKSKRYPSDRKTADDADKKKFTPSGRKKHYHNHHEDDENDEDGKEINQTNGPRLEMPLNKFIAHSGECSRRDAAALVKEGKVKVNGELVLDPGYRVQHDDKVTLSGKKLTPQKGMAYILLNKPKGFITTNDDPQGRKTVMELVNNSGIERLFPVGRLDKDTSGLLLITNDGDLTQKLCHPSYNIKKVYQVTLDKPVTKADFEKIVAGVELEDGKIMVDALAYLEKKNEIGLEIHSGRNRIVRRIFESLGYVVDKLDRVMYAGLTKKNLPRGKWRFLDPREVVLLKHFKS